MARFNYVSIHSNGVGVVAATTTAASTATGGATAVITAVLAVRFGRDVILQVHGQKKLQYARVFYIIREMCVRKENAAKFSDIDTATSFLIRSLLDSWRQVDDSKIFFGMALFQNHGFSLRSRGSHDLGRRALALDKTARQEHAPFQMSSADFT